MNFQTFISAESKLLSSKDTEPYTDILMSYAEDLSPDEQVEFFRFILESSASSIVDWAEENLMNDD